MHDVGEEFAEDVANRVGRAPAHRDIAPERGDVARLLAGLVGGVFLGAGINQDVAQRGGQRQRPLLAMQDVRQVPALDLVGEADFLALVEMLARPAVELGETLQRHDALAVEVEGLGEIEIGRVVGVPEMVVRRADDRVERLRAAAIALDRQHRREIVGRHGLVGRIVGDRMLDGLGICHRFRPSCIVPQASSLSDSGFRLAA